MIEELKEVFELATGATALIKEDLKLKANKKNQDENVISSKGDYAQIGSSGDYAQIGSSGHYAKIGSSGHSAKIGSSGDYAQIGSSGNYAQIDSSGDKAAISVIGFKSIAKGKIGSWITLSEYKQDEKGSWVVDFVKTEQIDGERIKEDIYYTLYNHEFAEVQIVDNVKTIILNRKKNVLKGLFLDSLNPCYVVEKDGIYSHGATLKEAKDSLIYKISNRDTSMYEDYTFDTVVTFEEAIKMYRVITGACEAGTRNFIEHLTKKKKKYTVREIITATKGQYGNDTFKEFFKQCGKQQIINERG